MSVGVSLSVSVRVVVGVTVAYGALLIGQGQSECWRQRVSVSVRVVVGGYRGV